MPESKQKTGNHHSNNDDITQMTDKQVKSQKKNSSNSDQIEFTGERFVPGIDDPVIMMEHMQRYLSLRNVIAGLDILDIACGEGYGCNLMADSARNVTGVDISQEAIKHAEKRYERDNLSFIQGSATDLSMFPDGSFDTVVSFETIEHIDEPSQNKFLEEIKRVLRPNGFLVMSTPDKKIYSDLHNYHNEYHVHEFYKDDFISFLKKKFKKITLFIQYFEVTGILEKESHNEQKNDNSIMRFGNTEEAEGKYLIAIASDEDISSSDLSSVYMNPVCEYNERISRILQLQDEVEERNNHIHHLDDHINILSERIGQLEKEVEELNNRSIFDVLMHKNKKKGA